MVVAPQGSGGAPHGFGLSPSPADMLSPYQTGAPSLGQRKAPVDRHLTEEKCTVALFAVMRRGRRASGTLVMRGSPHLLLLATWALCVTTRRRGAWQARCACPGSRAQRRKVHQRFVLVGPRCGRLLLGSACGTAHNSPFLVDLIVAETFVWSKPQKIPFTRCAFAWGCDPVAGQLAVFGGFDGAGIVGGNLQYLSMSGGTAIPRPPFPSSPLPLLPSHQ